MQLLLEHRTLHLQSILSALCTLIASKCLPSVSRNNPASISIHPLWLWNLQPGAESWKARISFKYLSAYSFGIFPPTLCPSHQYLLASSTGNCISSPCLLNCSFVFDSAQSPIRDFLSFHVFLLEEHLWLLPALWKGSISSLGLKTP